MSTVMAFLGRVGNGVQWGPRRSKWFGAGATAEQRVRGEESVLVQLEESEQHGE